MLDPFWTNVLAVTLVAYIGLMFGIGCWSAWAARDGSTEEFVLAGRKMPVTMASLTLVATWFGAGVMLTVADNVAVDGVKKSIMDPFGVALCLLLAAWWLARPLWEMGIVTLCDFYRRRYGVVAEKISALILVPSYFGWIAVQFVVLAGVLHLLFGIDQHLGVVLVMLGGTVYTLLGGMRAVALTDAVQMVIIVAGLVLLVAGVVWNEGWQATRATVEAAVGGMPTSRNVLLAVDWLAIGALGNLPAQDLIQRILCVGSARNAKQACYLSAGVYLLFGLVPVLLGLMAGRLAPELSSRVVLGFAEQTLHGPLMVVFILAIVSAVLSTISGAVLAPASVVAQNLVSEKFRQKVGPLAVNRAGIVLMSLFSLATAFSGDTTFGMLEDAYSLMLVGLVVPLLGGLWLPRRPASAAISSMAAGTAIWVVHLVCGWEDWFYESWLEPRGILLPANLTITGIAAIVFLVVGRDRPQAKGPI
jgi:solute:Na+ symporter, SSS family